MISAMLRAASPRRRIIRSAKRIAWTLAPAALAIFLSGPAHAQSPPPPPTSDDQVMTFHAPRARTMEEVSDESTRELHIGGARARYSLNFFGDTSFSVGQPTAPNFYPSFAIGPQDFLLKGQLGNNMVATTEFAMESSDEGTILDVERLHVRWQGEQFFIEAGRVHTAFGYWNNAYHHGRWLQPTITRPRWVDFEDNGGLLPVHWVGIDFGVKLKNGTRSLNFVASIGNGRGKIVDDVRTTHDYQSMKAFHASLEYVGLIWPDLRVGIAGIYDRIPAQPVEVRPALPDVSIEEFIGSAHIAYPSVPLILIIETYFMEHRHDSDHWTTYGGFGLLGYAFGPVMPYIRGERIASTGGLDPFLVPDPALVVDSFDSSQAIVGLRADLSDWTALKGEYRYTRFVDRSETTHQGVVSWSWGF
jgi:hypothetical protein